MTANATPVQMPSQTSPYLPHKTFNTGLAGIKAGMVPDVLDNSVRPPTMSSGNWRAFLSALKFFGMVKENGKTTQQFEDLVKSFKTDRWKTCVKTYLVPAYTPIIDGLPLENATAAQLDNAFRERGKVDNQVLRKCVRFFLYILTEAGVSYSPRFSMRREGTGAKPKKNKPNVATIAGAKKDSSLASNSQSTTVPTGMVNQPMQFRRKEADGTIKTMEGGIMFPEDVNEADCKIIEAQLKVIRLYAGIESD
ncbi:MAG: DUF5343 domain-containing protein [Pirellulales bacterium]